VIQQAPAPCEWYRAHEWDFNVWGTIAFPVNTGRNNGPFIGDEFDAEPKEGRFDVSVDIGEVSNDRLINRDDAWGGGAEIKYYFSKYWGIGGEGFVLDANKNIAGAGLFTFDFRFPIGCSRFAPYAWMGIGAISGGSHTIRLFNEHHDPEFGEEGEIEFETNQEVINNHTLAIGQFGGGLEVRITKHVGFTADVSYNAIQESNNDFWMARFGISLAY